MSYTEVDVQNLGDTLSSLPLEGGELNALHALIGFAAPNTTATGHAADLTQRAELKQELHRALFEPAST